ncbi:MAG: AMP-binding protein [Planctomycetota bacterium]|nr:MAG: AMP-binding protein [Planctomycetota bacterium]
MLVEAYLESIRKYPQKLAVRDPTREMTFSQLATFAQVIRREVLKATQCERVGLMLPASAACQGTILGILWAGKTIVPLNFLLQPGELTYVAADAGLDLVISIEYFKDLMSEIPVRTCYLEQMGLKRRYLWEKLRRTPEPPTPAQDDVAAIVYTSGSTGKPKGVCLTHSNFTTNCRGAIEHLQIGPDNHLLGVLPSFHVFGLTMLIFVPAVLGATATYIPRFSPQATYKALASGEITVFMGIPSMHNAIARLKNIDADKLTNVKLALSGGEPMPITVYDLVKERTGLELMQGYGLTETSPVISCSQPWAHRLGTVGKPIPGVEVQIRDEAGHALDMGQEGEICVRGPLVMKGYYNRPEETAAVIDREGWFRTGDIGKLDTDNYLTITGRAKDLIIVGGENVYPREIESVLEQHSAVSEAAVIGRPDASRGEVVIGFVTLDGDADITDNELRNFCREHLAGYKVPREISILPDFPRGPTGKILKRELN